MSCEYLYVLSFACFYRVSDQRQLTVHFQFPAGYPQTPILVELKSKTLPYKLLDGLVKLCDDEAKKYVGQRQVSVSSSYLHQKYKPCKFTITINRTLMLIWLKVLSDETHPPALYWLWKTGNDLYLLNM